MPSPRILLFACLVSISVSWSAEAQTDTERLAAWTLIQRMDQNRDGQLDTNEISPQSRPGLASLATSMGLPAEPPWQLEKLRKGLIKQQQREEKESRRRDDAPGGTATTDADPAPTPGRFGSESSKPTAFGAAESRTPVPGFGTRSPVSAPGQSDALSERPSNETPSTPRATKTTGDAESVADKAREGESDSAKRAVRRSAEALMRRFDRNGDQVLDESEYSRMSSDAARSDKNGDGKLTVDELSERLTEFGKAGRPSSASQKAGDRKAVLPEKPGEDGRRSYRIPSATERLTKSLPQAIRDWYLERDRDGDGQIVMSEFASVWSIEKVMEFMTFDLNNDGVITPSEYLDVKTNASR